jgi:hypothetical protein
MKKSLDFGESLRSEYILSAMEAQEQTEAIQKAEEEEAAAIKH